MANRVSLASVLRAEMDLIRPVSNSFAEDLRAGSGDAKEPCPGCSGRAVVTLNQRLGQSGNEGLWRWEHETAIDAQAGAGNV